ncbi:MAG: ABC transporter substrate-binding protein [Actinomycetota bacterium]|nr:ABC transporter substrate-binding protein [Actinomycetota bacterium]
MKKMHTRWLRAFVLVFAFALLAAACGDSDSDGDSTSAGGETDSTAAAADEGGDEEDDSSIGGGLTQDAIEDESTATTAASDAAPAEINTIDDVWAQAEAERDEIVAMLTAGIDAGDWGVGDDDVLRGPAGFEIDLSTCPDDWSNTHGIVDGTLRLGQSFVRSGNLAAYGNITVGMETYFDFASEQGGLDGLDIVFITKDDGYVAAQTIEFVDELIESENVFSIHTGGSPNTLAVYDKINNECIPQPLVATGHPAWGDPVNHPWTTGLQMSYSTEAILWGNWIRDNLTDDLPVKVAGLIMDNDFGLAYEKGFEAYVENNPQVVSDWVPVRHDPAAPTLTNEVTTIAAAQPDVFISMTAGNPCLLAIQEVDSAGLLDSLKAAFTPSVCKGIAAYMAPAGDAADDWWIVGGGQKDTTDPKYTSEPFIAWLNDHLTENGLDPAISLLGTGYMFAYPQVEALRIAVALPGGLTRTNFMLAVRSLDISHPMLLPGISFAANGTEDSYFIEGSDFSQFDAEGQTWNIIGDIVDVNGGSPNCAWDKDNGGCG